MKLITALATGFAAFTMTAASAIAVPETPPTSVDAVQYFKLKSELIEGKERFNDQYLITYHTGAGMNIADFTTNLTAAAVGHLNGSNLLFRLGSYDYALGLEGPEDLYGAWGRTTVDVTDNGSSGFVIDSHGYLVNVNADLGFQGWRICRWNHNVPELFHDTFEAAGHIVDANCARVNLIPVYV